MDPERLLQYIPQIGGENAWVYQVFIVIFTILLLNFVMMRLLQRMQKRFERTKTPWDDAFIMALRKPLRLLFWIAGLWVAGKITQRASDAEIFDLLDPLRDVGVIVAISWFLIRFIKSAEENIHAAGKHTGRIVDRTTTDAISRLLRISVYITATLVILQTLGFSISGVLAFGGIGGIAVGFAAKDLLANFFGGLMIFLDRPFSVGDWIRSPDKEIEGTVEEIGWRLTRIKTFDKRPLYVPNSTFMTIALENPSRMSHRRIYETFGIRYADIDKMKTITVAVKEMLLQHPDIDESQTLMVNFDACASSSINFFVYTFTHTTVWTEYHEIKQDVLLKINEIVAAHEAEMAFPTSTLHIPEQVNMQSSA
ncbi:mechanosensitive ion channel family protein [Sulfuriflexus sp.]|uniref:mechanosensitive ion channel family protein n=1 Tax=Sulfuriflexus sp. TaxID=2015443 RepID=UPI0028CD265D|nr:mechanosensitive ion channel family protein [Sulfuriflexus sp.]MDT8403700.1 mechanosensitive ion channel family protein [Sulfuriflexus sp.]